MIFLLIIFIPLFFYFYIYQSIAISFILAIFLYKIFEKKRSKLLGAVSSKEFYGALLKLSSWIFLCKRIVSKIQNIHKKKIKKGSKINSNIQLYSLKKKNVINVLHKTKYSLLILGSCS